MARPQIMVAPNGARRGKADHPALPISIDEIVQTASSCNAVGADALHLHVRDDDGGHSLDAGRYLETLSELRIHLPQMKVQVTTEAAGIFDVPAQIACLTRVRPEWASISVREVARAPELAPRVYALCKDQGTKVQHILYDADDIALLRSWRESGIVRQEPASVIFVLGRYTHGQVSAPEDLTPFRAAMPDVRDWMVCAFGAAEHTCLAAAAQQGGSVRVGFENSLTAVDGIPHHDNAASVAALVSHLERQSA